MSVVGAVTGNKSLMKIGGVLGLVGGVGGMFAGAGSGAASTALSETGTEAALNSASQEALGAYGGEAASQAAQVAGTEAMGAMDGVAGGGDFLGMVDDAQSSLGQMSEMTNEVKSATATAPDLQDAADFGDKVEPVSTKALIGESPTGAEQAAKMDSIRNGSDVMSDGFKPATASTPGGFGPPVGSKDYFNQFLNWVKNNKEVANGVMKLGGEALNGMAQRDMFDKKLAEQQRETNMRYGYGNQVASYGPKPLIGARA